MNRIDRLSAIVIQLQSKKVVTAKEIADRFDISLRTVYRDIRALEEAGVPIGAEAGVGYFIMEGYHLPPVVFTRDEASALLLSAKLIDKHADQSVRNHVDNAFFKIKAVLKGIDKEHLESLEEQVEVLNLPEADTDLFPNHFLTDIQNALVQKKVLKFDYYSNYNDEFNSREAEPMGLLFYSSHWHLIAYCRLRQGLRDFRIDRITKLTISEEQFEGSQKEAFQQFKRQLMVGSDLEIVKVRFTPEVARYIGEKRYFYGFVEETRTDDYIEMTFMVSMLKDFGRWLLPFGSTVEIISPLALKDAMRELVEDLLHYITEKVT
ncbi:MAG: YafY family protein [Bacteroidota bacterium]